MHSVPKTKDTILWQNQFGDIEYNYQVAATLQTDNHDFKKKIKEALAWDQIAQDIRKNLNYEEDFEEQDSILTYQELVYVPASCRKELVDEFHGAQPHGHQGSAKTLEQISQTYYFPHMQRFIEDALQKCNICRKAKHKKHQLYKLMKSLKMPAGAWTSVALDFIVKLSKSKEPITKVVYNSILVITDRLTKYEYFIPYKKASSAEDLAYIFSKYVVGNYELLEEIISNVIHGYSEHSVIRN